MNAKTILLFACIAIGIFNIFGVPFLFSIIGQKGTSEKLPKIVYYAVVGCGLLVIGAGLFFYFQDPKGIKFN